MARSRTVNPRVWIDSLIVRSPLTTRKCCIASECRAQKQGFDADSNLALDDPKKIVPNDQFTTYSQTIRFAYNSSDPNWRKMLRVLLAAEEFSR